jgi:PAS domain-containing protein
MVKYMIKSSKKFPWVAVILPGVYIALALWIDWITPTGIITPFFVVVGLLVMALTFRPVVMIPWAFVYTAINCSIYLIPKLFILFAGHPLHQPYWIAVIRAATYLLVGGLACYLCVALNRVRKSQGELNHILENLPWPILTSDQNGKILYWNAPAQSLLPELSQMEGMLNYFDLLAPPEFHGRTITEYLKRLECIHHEEPLKLSVKGRPFKGNTQLIEWTDQKVLLTILSEGEMTPHAIRL